MDKHAAVLSKVPELTALGRNLRAFIAANGRSFEGAGGAPAGSHADAHPAASGLSLGGASCGLSLGGPLGGEFEAASADASHGERDSRGGRGGR
jgi:hypothetical protein